MYSRWSAGSKMDPWETPALTGYFCEDFSIQNHPNPSITEKRKNKAKYLAWNSIRLKFVKKASMPNSVESLAYIKCNSLSSCRPVKIAANSIRYNCKKIHRFFKDFNNHRKKTNRAVVFSCRSFPNILKKSDYRWDLPTAWKTRLLQTLIEEFS